MIADAITNICGDSAEVISLMGAGVDPHLYKATEGDLEKLQSADLIFYNGLHLEGKMSEVLEKLAKQKKVIAFSDGLIVGHLRKVAENTYDPHIWFDVRLWKQAVDFAGGELAKNYPEKAMFFAKNLENYDRELLSLDSIVRLDLAAVPQEKRILITTHDAFSYFGIAYGFQVKALQGISTLSEAGLKDVADLVDFIVNNKIKAIFVETSVSQKAFRETILESCKAKNYEVTIGGELFTDALGQKGTAEGTYKGMFLFNTKTISQSLK